MKINLSKTASLTALTLIVVQAALYIFMWTRLLDDPSLKGMDFISFYTAGRIAREGRYGQLYDLDLQRAVQARIVAAGTFEGGANLSQHPPYLAPLLSLLAVDDFVGAYILWSAVRLGFTALCAVLTQGWLRASGWSPLSAWMAALGAVGFFPVYLGLLGGQDTVFILLGLLLWLFGMDKRREALAGFGLALSSLSPLAAGAVGLPLLATRRKAAAWFVGFMALLGIYSLLLVGTRGAADFLALMRLSSQGGGYGLNQDVMYNLLGLLLRSLPQANPATLRLAAWAAFAAALVFSAVWWRTQPQGPGLERVGLALVLLTFTLPHLHTHALSMLLLPLLIAAQRLHAGGRVGLALLLIPGVSTVLVLLTILAPTLTYPAYGLLMAGLALGLAWPKP